MREEMCSTPGCSGEVHARGWCPSCYGRVSRGGTPIAVDRGGAVRGALKRARLIASGFEVELAECRRMRELVIGLPARMYWRRKIDALEASKLKAVEEVERLEAAARPVEAVQIVSSAQVADAVAGDIKLGAETND